VRFACSKHAKTCPNFRDALTFRPHCFPQSFPHLLKSGGGTGVFRTAREAVENQGPDLTTIALAGRFRTKS
jgi:hypothetical protein